MSIGLTLDSDVALLVERAMRDEGASLHDVVNRVLRESLGARALSRLPLPILSMGEELVDLTKANQVAEALEDAEIAAKLERG